MIRTVTLLITCAITWTASSVIGQTFDKQTILEKYSKGQTILEFINESNTSGLEKELIGSENLDKLLTIVKTNRHKADSITMNHSIYFDPIDKKLVFTISAGKTVNNGTKWGLFDYLFVLELRINSQPGDDRLASLMIILDNETKLKSWWQSYMTSYTNKTYLRDEWAEKFKIIPPPPPPPETTDWFQR